MDLRVIRWGGMDWNDLEDIDQWWALCENGKEPSGSIKCRKFLSRCTTGSSMNLVKLSVAQII
jgi:hypothetical protein